MTTINIQLTGVCVGGNHLTFDITGAAARTQVLDLALLSAPIDEREVAAFLKVICKLAKQGRTNAQARTLLQVGVTVIV